MQNKKKNNLQKQSLGSVVTSAAQPIMQIGLSSLSPILLYCDPTIGTFSLAFASAASNAAGSLLTTVLDYIKQKRLELGIKKVNSHKIPLDKFLKNNKSVSNLAAALDCISNASRDEKIEYIANLICNSALNDSISEENDIFEMKLRLLDEISFDEIGLLESLYRNTVLIPEDLGNHQKGFIDDINLSFESISSETGIPIEFIPHRLDKLNGIGLCGKDIMLQFTFGMTKAVTYYYSSPLYLELRDYILKVNKSKGK